MKLGINQTDTNMIIVVEYLDTRGSGTHTKNSYCRVTDSTIFSRWEQAYVKEVLSWSGTLSVTVYPFEIGEQAEAVFRWTDLETFIDFLESN